MEVKIHPPPAAIAPWGQRWYEIEVTEVKFDVAASINEHPILDKERFLFSQYLHPTSSMDLDCVLTANSDIEGSDIEDKKNNLIIAVNKWWSYGDVKKKTDCARIYWRGWEQYMIIENLEIGKIAGESIEYEYSMKCIIHEGSL